MTAAAKVLVTSLWAAVAARNWAAVGDLIAPDGIYYDAPLGPTVAARGPEGVVSRLRLALDGLGAYSNFEGRMVGEDDIVMYEHSEKWVWPGGETVLLPFVSVHRVLGGKIALWADYWNYATLLDAAPPGWQDSLMSADMSWMYDATGQV